MTDVTAYPTRLTYLSEGDFLADGVLGGVRDASGERDYGVWWRSSDRPHPVFRITHINDTYEVIAVCLGGEARGQIQVLASGISEEDAEICLEGWVDNIYSDGSLFWVINRLQGFPPKVS